MGRWSSRAASSGVTARWRSSAPNARAETPTSRQLVVEQLDERLDWLESLGATVTERETVNPLTTGRRFPPDALVAALLREAGEVRLGEPLVELGDEPLVLATGGFGVALARQARRSRCGRARGARATDSPSRASVVRPRRAGWMSSSGASSLRRPARVGEGDFVRLAQLYGRHALVLDETGAAVESASCAWHENDLVQEIARRPAGRAWFLVAEETLDLAAGDATVRERIEAAREAGGTVVGPGRPPVRGAVRLPLAVHVTASVTHTIGGIVVDREARVLDDEGSPIDGLYAAGVDVGGIATGGYSSGLAAALVLGCVAAESIAG